MAIAVVALESCQADENGRLLTDDYLVKPAMSYLLLSLAETSPKDRLPSECRSSPQAGDYLAGGQHISIFFTDVEQICLVRP